MNVIQWSAYLVLVAVLGCFLWNNLASFAHRQVGAAAGGGDCAEGGPGGWAAGTKVDGRPRPARFSDAAPWPPTACRPPVSVPLVFKEGISEGQAKAYAEKATAYINKGLGAPAASQQAPHAAVARVSTAAFQNSLPFCALLARNPCLPGCLLALPSSFCANHPPLPPLPLPAPCLQPMPTAWPLGASRCSAAR